MSERTEIAVLCEPAGLHVRESHALAARLGLACVSAQTEQHAVLLRVTSAGVCAEPCFLPGADALLLDFSHGALGHRVRGAGGEMLLRALGGRDLHVLDGTGGLGRDAFLMARAGCTVTVCERTPAVFALLEDGLRRAALAPELAADAARISLRFEDAEDVLRDAASAYDVVYLDPMFPERSKTAQVRKEQRILQQLAGQDPDAAAVARLARRRVRKRVVVKRPKGAPELLPGVHARVTGRKVRFDLYMPESGAGRSD